MTNLDLGFWHFAVLSFGSILSCDLLFRLPLFKNLKNLDYLLRRILKILRSSRVSDHWKERVMLVYAFQLLRLSLALPVLLLTALSPLGVGLWVATESIDALIRLTFDWRILLGISVLSMLYFSVRKRFNA